MDNPVFYKKGVFGENECYFKCEVADGEPKLSATGPETITQTNWYNPEWVSLEKFKTLESVYPQEIKSGFLIQLRLCLEKFGLIWKLPRS